MRLIARHLRTVGATVAAVAALAACSDDNGNGPDAPFAPQNVVATAASPTSIVVTWSAVSGADGYQVERAPQGGTFAEVGSRLSTTTYTDDAVTAETQYQYRVRAFRGNTPSNYSNVVSITTQSAGPKAATLAGEIAQSRTLYRDTLYTLSGFVKVKSGATLTIQPGTKIVGDAAVPGSSLWILRGARIDAQGTATEPIVFTSAKPAGSRKPGDWGGIVIVGNARINRTANPIFTEGPAAEAVNYAGGADDDDDSGILRYVRIEFAGYDVSNGQGQELNGLSMYAVGRGTTIEYVQTFGGLDDSFEWFGGAVDARYLVSYESGDDHFDFAEGFRGRVQNMIALQTQVIQPAPSAGTLSSDPRGFEGDGCESNKAGCTYANQPYTAPVFANFTVVGPGAGVFAANDGNGAVVRRGAAATFVNGIIARWPGVGISIRDAESDQLRQKDSLTVRNVILAENGSNFEAAGTNFGAALNTPANQIQSLTGAGSAAALFASLTPASLDWTPAAGSAARTGSLADFAGTAIAGRVSDLFNQPGTSITATNYIGAADPDGVKWWQGWTAYYACTANGC
ncbi:MAG TPA: fibronectin type III domain-containing protein [Gemmatimonadaceae bacterium]|nr:fibronectin type III domain-containing protein [Gemmatimonadaceae bacterium]